MKTMLIAFVAIAVIAVGANMVLKLSLIHI